MWKQCFSFKYWFRKIKDNCLKRKHFETLGIYLIAIVLSTVYSLYFDEDQLIRFQLPNVAGFNLTALVSQLTWNYQQTIANMIVSGVPIRLVDTQFAQTSSVLSLRYLKSFWPDLQDQFECLQHPSKIFAFEDVNKPLYDVTQRTIDMLPSGPSFLYNLKFESMMCIFDSKLLPRGHMPFVDWASLTDLHFSNMISVEPQNGTLRAHFNPMDRVLCQSVGESRILLFNPTSYNHFLPYPFSHPLTRHAQRRRQNETEGVAIYMKASQCLYIPAFWFVWSQSVEPSIIVHILSYSPLQNRIDNICQKHKLPSIFFDSDIENYHLRITSFTYWLQAILVLIFKDYLFLVLDRLLRRYEELPEMGCANFHPGSCPVFIELDPEWISTMNEDIEDFAFDILQFGRRSVEDFSKVEIATMECLEKITGLVMGIKNVCTYMKCVRVSEPLVPFPRAPR